ncbi:hypothetical protein EST38_g11178 [Candolleomyces aberdarensis]|uniref:Xylanolytic transcriptional activator regulatory domain-containing protein n=1 Tax=Candolleomyces aberdarensis TaxID=2316362 RepID=A0A4Q2D730_9AGAR|nr:hypothetical protein EST38_g11178 [Candolleomyces aberdarensis]
MDIEPQRSPTNQAPSGSSARKAGLSCAECRRSKLKCDSGSSADRVLMAHAQRLQEQVKSLTSRCRELERELAQAKGDDAAVEPYVPPHRDSPDNLSNMSETLGSLSIGLDGQARYHGETAGSEYFQDLLPNQDEQSQSNNQLVDLPTEILDLMNAFPFGFRDAPYEKDIFLEYIPDLPHAQQLADLYFVNIGWMYEPLTSQDFRTSVLDVIYGPTGEKSLDAAHAHRISLLFIVCANGAAFHDDPRVVSTSKSYQALARAAFSMDSILVEATCASAQTLFLIVRFIYNADRDKNEERWLITGLNSRLATMIGLQRDSANWNLPAEDVQRRRRVFWELFVWDAWTSVVNGRPAALAVQHTDCQFPDDVDPSIGPNKEIEIGWHAWKLRYGANILTASSYHVFSPRTPPYKTLLDLDKKIRSFPLPSHLRSPVRNTDTTRSWNQEPSRAMQQYCAICLRESNLLYIHRSYFAQALRQLPDNPLQHAFAASVLAAYRSSTRLIASLRSLYGVHPRLTSTVWYFWSGVFSSCIVLGALVVESPKCTLAPDALRELQAAIPFYELGSRSCRSQTTMPILEKLLGRAIAAYQAGSGIQLDLSSEVDELSVLGGRKAVIKAGSNDSTPPATDRGTPSSIPPDSDDRDSPNSNSGAMEMLHEYYGSLGQQPPRNCSMKYEYEQDSSMASFSEEASYASKPTTMSSHQPPQAYARPFLSPPGSMVAPEPGLDYHQASQMQMYGQTSQQQQQQQQQFQQQQQQQPPSQQQQPWNSPYVSPTSHHPHHEEYHYHQQQSPTQHHPSVPSTPLMYGHPLNINPPHAYPQIIQRYAPGVVPERTQEEIWRDFMMGYQQPN